MHKIKFLSKVENPAAYAKLASEGVLLGYPVKIKGQTHRSDNNIPYHSSVKFFDSSKDHAHQIHALARHLPLNPPDAKNTQIGFDKFKDRVGNDVHVITLHGNSADKLKEHNGKFAHMGFPSTFEWKPHVSVDSDTWNKIKASGAKTAHEAGIEFGPAELKHGHKTLKTYHHEADSSEPKVPDHSDLTAKVKVAKSEELQNIEKGAFKNASIALGMASALAGAHNNTQANEKVSSAPKAPISSNRSPASIPHSKNRTPSYDHQKMLRTLAQVESSGGKDTNHEATPQGTGYGKYALMPNTIHMIVQGHRDLRTKHGKALALNGPQLHQYMDDNKGLEDVIADRYLSHIEHKLGKDPGQNGYAWFQGIKRTKEHKKSGVDIKNHWRTKRVKEAYDKEK